MGTTSQIDLQKLVLPDWVESALSAIDGLFPSIRLYSSEPQQESFCTLRKFLEILTCNVWNYLASTLDQNRSTMFHEGLALLHEHLLAVFTYI
ncbi:hypothetical protein G3M48_003388, partial [Beauveria asiatica]